MLPSNGARKYRRLSIGRRSECGLEKKPQKEFRPQDISGYKSRQNMDEKLKTQVRTVHRSIKPLVYIACTGADISEIQKTKTQTHTSSTIQDLLSPCCARSHNANLCADSDRDKQIRYARSARRALSSFERVLGRTPSIDSELCSWDLPRISARCNPLSIEHPQWQVYQSTSEVCSN